MSNIKFLSEIEGGMLYKIKSWITSSDVKLGFFRESVIHTNDMWWDKEFWAEDPKPVKKKAVKKAVKKTNIKNK
jgi:hypothetical protein